MAATLALSTRTSSKSPAIALPTLLIAAVAGWLGWVGWTALAAIGPFTAIRAGQVRLTGPIVISFVLVVFVVEQIAPAQRRPVLARGHLLDLAYLITHALFVVPFVVLIGTGFSALLAHLAPWLVIPHFSGISRWPFIALAVAGIDAMDWLAHVANHQVTALWRLHAVHHSVEEMSVLSTFRAHPLANVSFVISAIPILVLSANIAAPAAVLTAYACAATLPHANLRWTYGWLDRVVVSPHYHRRHHSPTQRTDVNIGTLLTVWDQLARRAVFEPMSARVAPTGLAGRPVFVEQQPDRLAIGTTVLRQLVGPFLRPHGPNR